MKEEYGNVWELECDGICIPTNRTVKEDGRAVMGAGVAKQALERYPRIDKIHGQHLTNFPNTYIFTLVIDFVEHKRIISFPTKYDWKDKADIELIKKSCKKLMTYIDDNKLERVLLPRPGCGLGGLKWEDVKPQIAPLLDDRCVIVTNMI